MQEPPLRVTAPTGWEISLSQAASNAATREFLQAVQEALVHYRIAAADRINAELLLAEVLNNVVKHAFAESQEGGISTSIHVADGHLQCCVLDRGQALKAFAALMQAPQEVQQPKMPNLPEGGFGWVIIRQLAQEIDYRRADGQNRLTFTMPFHGAG